jgi:hypothetical protein
VLDPVVLVGVMMLVWHHLLLALQDIILVVILLYSMIPLIMPLLLTNLPIPMEVAMVTMAGIALKVAHKVVAKVTRGLSNAIR